VLVSVDDDTGMHVISTPVVILNGGAYLDVMEIAR